MTTVSIPAPVKRGVRRTSSQATSARLRLRPLRRLRSVAFGTQPARRARSGLGFFAEVGLERDRQRRRRDGIGTSSARGSEETTTRAVWPCRRALT